MGDYIVLLSERIDPAVKKGVAVATAHYPVITKLDSPELIECYRISLAGDNKFLDPNKCLYYSLKNATDNSNLLAAGMAIRYGADVNQLCQTDLAKGDLHLICYTILENPNVEMRRLLVAMLVFSGGRMTDKAYKGSDISVFEWIQDNVGRLGLPARVDGPSPDPDDVEFYRKLEPELSGDAFNGDAKVMLGLALDNSQLVNMADSSMDPQEVLHLAVEWHSSDVFDEISRDRLTPELMVKSIDNYNLSTFNACVMGGGFLPNYLIANNMLVRVRRLFREKRFIPYLSLTAIVESSIRYGLQLDKEQLLMLSSTDKFTLDKIKKLYQIPFWEKECKSYRTPLSARLQALAQSLHLQEGEKENICKRVALMAAGDAKLLVEKVVERRRLLLDAEYSEPMPGGIPKPATGYSCSTLVDDKINEYSDLDTVKYRDITGIVWCFTRDKIDMLLQDRTNPITSQPLPEAFLIRLEAQRKILQSLGAPTDQSLPERFINMNQPVPISNALASLREKDTVNDVESRVYRESFEKYLEIKGMDIPSVRAIAKEQLQFIITDFIEESTNFEELTQTHAYTTFCRIARSIISNRQVGSESLLSAIQYTLMPSI